MSSFDSLLAKAVKKTGLPGVNAIDERTKKEKICDFMEKLLNALGRKDNCWREPKFRLSRHALTVDNSRVLGDISVNFWWHFEVYWDEEDEIFTLQVLGKSATRPAGYSSHKETIVSSKIIPDLDPESPPENQTKEIADRIHGWLLITIENWIEAA